MCRKKSRRAAIGHPRPLVACSTRTAAKAVCCGGLTNVVATRRARASWLAAGVFTKVRVGQISIITDLLLCRQRLQMRGMAAPAGLEKTRQAAFAENIRRIARPCLLRGQAAQAPDWLAAQPYACRNGGRCGVCAKWAAYAAFRRKRQLQSGILAACCRNGVMSCAVAESRSHRPGAVPKTGILPRACMARTGCSGSTGKDAPAHIGIEMPGF